MSENQNNPFGVLEFLQWNHSWNSYKYPSQKELEKSVKLMKEAGVGWVRVDFLWEDIEPQQGNFDFAKYDNMVKLLSENNLQILGLLNYTASWAASDGKWNSPPKENQLFVNYATKVIERYKDKVKYWELWNEPDSATYWTRHDGLQSYCQLLREVYLAAKKVDPGCKILNGGFANPRVSTNQIYENGAKNYFDILNVHLFENPLNPSAIKVVASFPKLIHKAMERHGDGAKKIWITEIGCPGVKRGVQTKKWWMDKNPSERQQAEWVKKIYTTLLKDENVEKIFWAFFRDCHEHWETGVDYFGLIRWDFSKKPSFKAYEKCFQNWNKSR